MGRGERASGPERLVEEKEWGEQIEKLSE